MEPPHGQENHVGGAAKPKTPRREVQRSDAPPRLGQLLLDEVFVFNAGFRLDGVAELGHGLTPVRLHRRSGFQPDGLMLRQARKPDLRESPDLFPQSIISSTKDCAYEQLAEFN